MSQRRIPCLAEMEACNAHSAVRSADLRRPLQLPSPQLGDAPSAGTRSTGGAGITPGAAASGSFTPWWELQEARELTLGPTGQRLVVELREAALAAATAAAVLLPAAPEAPLPPLSSLTKAAPSPLLAWHLLEVLFAYCYTVRRFRGSWAGQEGSAAAVMLALTDVLAAAAAGSRGGRGQGGGGGGEAEEEGGAARLPETAAQACLHVLERACGPPVGTAQVGWAFLVKCYGGKGGG